MEQKSDLLEKLIMYEYMNMYSQKSVLNSLTQLMGLFKVWGPLGDKCLVMTGLNFARAAP